MYTRLKNFVECKAYGATHHHQGRVLVSSKTVQFSHNDQSLQGSDWKYPMDHQSSCHIHTVKQLHLVQSSESKYKKSYNKKKEFRIMKECSDPEIRSKLLILTTCQKFCSKVHPWCHLSREHSQNKTFQDHSLYLITLLILDKTLPRICAMKKWGRFEKKQMHFLHHHLNT